MFALCVSFIFAIYRLFCVFIDFYYIVFLFILFDHQHGEHLYIYIIIFVFRIILDLFVWTYWEHLQMSCEKTTQYIYI